MDKNLVESKLREITQKIVARFDPERVILFGSQAWGEPGPDSDIDLLVVHESHDRKLEREVELRKVIFPSGVAVDILSYTPEEVQERLLRGDFFVKKIITAGRLLYAR